MNPPIQEKAPVFVYDIQTIATEYLEPFFAGMNRMVPLLQERANHKAQRALEENQKSGVLLADLAFGHTDPLHPHDNLFMFAHLIKENHPFIQMAKEKESDAEQMLRLFLFMAMETAAYKDSEMIARFELGMLGQDRPYEYEELEKIRRLQKKLTERATPTPQGPMRK